MWLKFLALATIAQAERRSLIYSRSVAMAVRLLISSSIFSSKSRISGLSKSSTAARGLLRDAALRKALQIDTAVIWFNSPGVRQSNGSDSD